MGFIVLHPKFSNCKHDIFCYKHTSILTSIDKQSIYYIIYNFHNAHAISWIYKYIFHFFSAFCHFKYKWPCTWRNICPIVFLSKVKWPSTWRNICPIVFLSKDLEFLNTGSFFKSDLQIYSSITRKKSTEFVIF